MSEISSPSPKTLLSRWWFWVFIAFPAAVMSVFLGSLLAHFTVGRSSAAIKLNSDTVHTKTVEPPEHKAPESTHEGSSTNHENNAKTEGGHGASTHENGH